MTDREYIAYLQREIEAMRSQVKACELAASQCRDMLFRWIDETRERKKEDA